MDRRKFAEVMTCVISYCLMAVVMTCAVVFTASFMIAAAKFVLWIW